MHIRKKDGLAKAFDAFPSFFVCTVVFYNRILYIAVRLNLGQKHKRQAEAPNASHSNMYTVQS